MLTLEQSGYRGRPYIHTDLLRHPVTFVWWAKTPTGRQSRYLNWWTAYRLRNTGKLKKSGGYLCPVYVPTSHYGKSLEELLKLACAKANLPKLRPGYQWVGPFINYMPGPVPEIGSNQGPGILMAEEPKESDGIPLSYIVGPGLDVRLGVGG